jgi:hypothetical protein
MTVRARAILVGANAAPSCVEAATMTVSAGRRQVFTVLYM